MILQMVLLGVLTAAAVLKSVELVRAPRDRLRWYLVSCLWLLALGQAVSVGPVTGLVDAGTSAGFGKVVYNALVMAGLYLLLCFFVSARRAQTTIRRRLRADGLLLALTGAGLVLLMLLTPAGLRAHSLAGPHIAHPAIAAFYVLGNGYFVYAYATVGAAALRYAAAAPRFLSLALKVTALGMAGLVLTSVGRAGWVVLRYSGDLPPEPFNTVNWQAANVSLILVIVGMCLLAVGHGVLALRSWRHQRDLHRQLTPLWAVVREAYPELVLDRKSGWTPARTRRGFYRRLIECRDGLVRLSPYIALAAGDRDVSRVSAAELAGFLPAALRLRPQLAAEAGTLAAREVAVPHRERSRRRRARADRGRRGRRP